MTYEAIAVRHGVNVRKVQRWVEAYEAHGVDGLRDKPHAGKLSGCTEAQRRRIAELALKSPRLFGYLRNGWIVRLLARHLIKEPGSAIETTRKIRLGRRTLAFLHKETPENRPINGPGVTDKWV